MKGNETLNAASRERPALIASWIHFAGFLAIMAAICALGFYARHAGSGSSAGSGQLAGHGYAIRIYLMALLMDWALLYFCWVGVHCRGGNLWALSGGRWKSGRDVVTDLAVALPFWVVWEGTAYGVHWLLDLLGSGSAKSVESLLPKSLSEVLVWVAGRPPHVNIDELIIKPVDQAAIHKVFKRQT